MRGNATHSFTTTHAEGLLLPPELLTRISDLDRDLPGLKPGDYHLPKGERINEAVNRAWNRLLGLWSSFQAALAELPESDAATALTRERWLLPLFQELGYGRLQRHKAIEIGGRNYAISHYWEHAPIHLIGARLDLDRRAPGQGGAAQASPHGLVQQFLNRSDEHLWAMVSNGLRLRLLRDNVSLTRQAYVEFDLAAMMEGELYSDFRLLWLVCHQSRVESERPETCWLEKWSILAREQGTRALEQLRGGVERAIEALGSGFLAHPANTTLRDRLGTGELDAQDYYRQLLRLVYRLIFLFVAEDRGLLLDSGADETTKQRYRDYYSTVRLRRLAARLRGTRHDDLYQALAVVMECLHERGSPELGLPALGSFLWSPTTVGDLAAQQIANRDLLEAVRALGFTRQGRALRPVDYQNLGSEELGSVYESLLELHPRVHREAHTFKLETAPGHERKTTGSYYTPESLIQELLNSALDPVLEEAATKDDPEHAILNLKVCDPAVGSGHFLVAAAHRMARRLAAVRSGEEEPAPGEVRRALRQVVGHCLYGVDVNPMAVELCKVSLWLEAMEPGKPLTFLDHHIRCGNSLLGTTPELIAQGIPDDAFKPIEGDDKKVCSSLKKRNTAERGEAGGRFAQRDMLHMMVAEPEAEYQTIAVRSRSIDQAPDETFADIQRKAEQFQRLVVSPEYRHAQHVADAWCAAFVWTKTADAPEAITTDTVRRLEADANALGASQRNELDCLAREYQFFHWQLAFPEVYEPGGFDLVVGNPPWELMEAKGNIASSDQFARTQLCFRSGRYRVLKGRRDLYKLFLANCSGWLQPAGRLAFLTPLGVFIEDDARMWRQALFNEGSLVELRHFQNQRKRFFPEVHASYRFCGVVFTPTTARPHVFSTVAGTPEQISRQYFVTVPRDEFDQWLGADRSATIYPDARYAVLHRVVARRLQENDSVSFKVVAEFHSSSDKKLIKSKRPVNGWALLKNRNIHFFDCEFAPHEAWIEAQSVGERAERKGLLSPAWIERFPRLVFRDIARNDDERTLISCLAPPGAVSTYDTPMFLPDCEEGKYPEWAAFYCAVFSSYLFDFLIRPFVDKHIKGYTLARVPWPRPDSVNKKGITNRWILGRILELVYTSERFESFSEDCGWDGPPFRATEHRQFYIRCELDAAFFHLFVPADQNGRWPLASEAAPLEGEIRFQKREEIDHYFEAPRDAVAFIMDTFPVVGRKDEKIHGDYRTKRVILEIYDAMQEAIRTGQPYRTRLDPPPGPPLDADGNFVSYADIAANPPPHIHSPLEVARPAAVDFDTLVDGAWARPMADQRAETGVQLAAILKAMDGPLPVRQVRLAALLALEPRLLLTHIDDKEAASWQRLVGAEADPLPQGASAFVARNDQAWGAAVRNLRANGHLIEDIQAGTWAPGDNLDRFPPSEWADGRARMVLDVLQRHAIDTVVAALPDDLRDLVNDVAAA